MHSADIVRPAGLGPVGGSTSSFQPFEKSEIKEEQPIRTVDDLVRHRAQLFPHQTVVSYPSSGVDYVDYNMQQLDVFAYRAARHFRHQLPPRGAQGEKPGVVAMLGPSNFEYLITMLAMIKMGHTILFLSTRISAEAITSLMTKTEAKALIFDDRYATVAHKIKDSLPQIQVVGMVRRTEFEFPVEAHGDTRMCAVLDPEQEAANIVYIIHSSGSTGFPKPIYQNHKAALANYATSMEMKAFITLPLYHNHGICNFFRAVYCGKPIHIYNADLPLTSEYLTTIFQQHEFEIFYGVPYALKLLAETELGLSLLRDLKVVMYGGSACPDELGNLLVDSGVNLVSHYGATEVGQLMTSFRPPSDKAWNYVREHARLSPYLKWIPVGSGLYECCVLEGWPAKLESSHPDGSYATKDLFEPHPTIPKAWKYIARRDDTIVLVNGEKFNPVQMEGKIRSQSSVAEAVVFGAARPYLGMLVVPAESTKSLSSSQILDDIWPVIQDANQTAEAYARVSKNMVKILPHNTEYPRTDKGSIIRQAFYKIFAEQIEDTYTAADSDSSNVRAMGNDELKAFLRSAIVNLLSSKPETLEGGTDFFSLGMDSLQAIQLRSEILRNVDVGSQKVGQNVVFDFPSIEKLGQHLMALRTGSPSEDTSSVEEQMLSLVDKYAVFSSPSSRATSVVVTGATGSLGAHVVARLALDPSVDRIYCLVRAKDDEQAMSRIKDSLIQRNIYDSIPAIALDKLQAFPFTQSDPKLGLSEDRYTALARNLSTVIHCAWSVNFSLNLSSFEHDCIAGVQHLINLCLASSNRTEPATFNFCSSVSTVARAPVDEIPEALPQHPSWAQGMGYAQSKFVAEHLCLKAAERTGVKARVLRVGQIVGDTQHGIWNATEAIPLQLQTALTVGCLPRLPETPSWLPVDVVAQAVMDISLSSAPSSVLNVVNRGAFRWTEDLLPMLRAAGLSFEEVSPREWVRRLRESNADPIANPPIKLAGFFASKYDKDMAEFSPSKKYATTEACRLSPALAQAPVLDQNDVNKFVQYFLSSAWKTS